MEEEEGSVSISGEKTESAQPAPSVLCSKCNSTAQIYWGNTGKLD